MIETGIRLGIVVGARPNFIKVAPLITAIKKNNLKNNNSIYFFLIHTGQHYDDNMSDVFFKEMGIPMPDYNLNIGSGNHGKQTGEMLQKIEEILILEKPNLLISIGDTNSTLAGALAATKLHIPIAHIEAGVRLFNKKIPEEVNRILTDHISDLLFIPTESAKINLINEGIDKSKVYFYGDLMYDATIQFNKIAELNCSILEKLNIVNKKFILATIHRAENTTDIERLKIIFDSFVDLSAIYKIILPIHPRTKNFLKQHNLFDYYSEHLNLIDPIGYLDMLALEKNTLLIVTDSGGVQREAFFQQVPCVTIFENTPWTELVELGWNTIVPPKSKEFIVKNIYKVLKNKKGEKATPYGKGNSGELIIKKIVSFLNSKLKQI